MSDIHTVPVTTSQVFTVVRKYLVTQDFFEKRLKLSQEDDINCPSVLSVLPN